MSAKPQAPSPQRSERANITARGSQSRISDEDPGTHLSDDDVRRWFERDPNTKLREQLRRTVCTIVALGIVKPGHAVPGIKRIARLAKIYPSALAFVYSTLEADGVLRGEQGRGFFVVDPHVARKELASEQLGCAIHACRRFGLKDRELASVFKEQVARRALAKGDSPEDG